eukprot:gene12167-15280_t
MTGPPSWPHAPHPAVASSFRQQPAYANEAYHKLCASGRVDSPPWVRVPSDGAETTAHNRQHRQSMHSQNDIVHRMLSRSIDGPNSTTMCGNLRHSAGDPHCEGGTPYHHPPGFTEQGAMARQNSFRQSVPYHHPTAYTEQDAMKKQNSCSQNVPYHRPRGYTEQGAMMKQNSYSQSMTVHGDPRHSAGAHSEGGTPYHHPPGYTEQGAMAKQNSFSQRVPYHHPTGYTEQGAMTKQNSYSQSMTVRGDPRHSAGAHSEGGTPYHHPPGYTEQGAMTKQNSYSQSMTVRGDPRHSAGAHSEGGTPYHHPPGYTEQGAMAKQNSFSQSVPYHHPPGYIEQGAMAKQNSFSQSVPYHHPPGYTEQVAMAKQNSCNQSKPFYCTHTSDAEIPYGRSTSYTERPQINASWHGPDPNSVPPMPSRSPPQSSYHLKMQQCPKVERSFITPFALKLPSSFKPTNTAGSTGSRARTILDRVIIGGAPLNGSASHQSTGEPCGSRDPSDQPNSAGSVNNGCSASPSPSREAATGRACFSAPLKPPSHAPAARSSAETSAPSWPTSPPAPFPPHLPTRVRSGPSDKQSQHPRSDAGPDPENQVSKKPNTGTPMGGRKVAFDPRLDPNIDPKRAKRIIDNRESAARSYLKKRAAAKRTKEAKEAAAAAIALSDASPSRSPGRGQLGKLTDSYPAPDRTITTQLIRRNRPKPQRAATAPEQQLAGLTETQPTDGPKPPAFPTASHPFPTTSQPQPYQTTSQPQPFQTTSQPFPTTSQALLSSVSFTQPHSAMVPTHLLPHAATPALHTDQASIAPTHISSEIGNEAGGSRYSIGINSPGPSHSRVQIEQMSFASACAPPKPLYHDHDHFPTSAPTLGQRWYSQAAEPTTKAIVDFHGDRHGLSRKQVDRVASHDLTLGGLAIPNRPNRNTARGQDDGTIMQLSPSLWDDMEISVSPTDLRYHQDAAAFPEEERGINLVSSSQEVSGAWQSGNGLSAFLDDGDEDMFDYFSRHPFAEWNAGDRVELLEAAVQAFPEDDFSFKELEDLDIIDLQ